MSRVSPSDAAPTATGSTVARAEGCLIKTRERGRREGFGVAGRGGGACGRFSALPSGMSRLMTELTRCMGSCESVDGGDGVDGGVMADERRRVIGTSSSDGVEPALELAHGERGSYMEDNGLSGGRSMLGVCVWGEHTVEKGRKKRK